MASHGQVSGRSREPLQRVWGRLYKFALVLTVNDELARGLLRGTYKALAARNEWRDEDRDRLIEALRRMYLAWSTKAAEDSDIERRFPADPRLIANSFASGPFAGNMHFANFIVSMPSTQRAALYLVYGEGCSYEEAAEVTSLNMLALMKLLARGHLALSHWLDQRGITEETVRPAPIESRWRERVA